MESKIFIALFIAALLAFAAGSDDDSNDSDSGSGSMGSWGDSFEEKDDDCDRLVDGSDDDDNEGKCDLTDGLEEASDKSDCTEDQKTIITKWISELKILLKVKLSIEERLTIALSSIQKFEIENPEIYELIQWQNISSWGYLASFTKVVEFRQSKKIESIFTLDDEDNCPLFDALFNATSDSYEQESAVNAFINETLIKICGDMTLSVTKKSVMIYQAISEFFAIHSEWQSSFFQFKIEGFGSFQQFFEVTRSYYQKSKVDSILEGNVEECGFIVAFKNQLELMQSDSSISLSIKGTLKQFYKRILQQLSFGVTGKARLSIIIKEMREFIVLYPSFSKWIYSIQIEGFGSFWDVINCGPWKIGFPHVTKPTVTGATWSSPKPTCSCSCSSMSTLLP